MNIEVLQDSKNILLKRRDVKFKVTQTGTTPSRVDVKRKLAALLNTDEKLIVINKMNCTFGKQETLGFANIYENEERLKQVAHEHLLKRDVVKAKTGEAGAETGAQTGAQVSAPASAQVEAKVEVSAKGG